MPGDGLLDHPDFLALSEVQRREVEAAMADPEKKLDLVLRTVLVLRLEASAAGDRCRDTCAPMFDRRLHDLEEKRIPRLERFKAWLVGIGVGIGAIVGLLSALWAIFGRAGP